MRRAILCIALALVAGPAAQGGWDFDGGSPADKFTANVSLITNDEAFAIAAWVTPDDISVERAFLQIFKSPIAEWADFGHSPGLPPSWRMDYTGAVAFGGGPADPANGTLVNFCARNVSSTSRFIYIDGIESTENTTSRTGITFDRTRLGSNWNDGGSWNGQIYNLALWNDEIPTAADMASLAAGKHPLRLQAFPDHWYHLDTDRDPVLDLIGGQGLASAESPTYVGRRPTGW